jgi:hypothetical protein
MGYRTLALAIALFSISVLIPGVSAAQQGDQGVQVGVPGGRGGAPGPGRRRDSGPAAPTPRSKEGKVLLGGSTPTERGLWLPGPVVTTPLAPSIPFQPWARALYAEREKNRLEPHARCKPSGAARQVQTPYGVEFVDLPDMQRVFIFDVGGPHTFRTVYMDGRTHPQHLVPSYYGHSIGWWDGDTLVIDTTGYNESFWLDRMGVPHTETLHTLERVTRADARTIQYELTVDDPAAYTAAWSARFNLFWEQGTELFEYVCQEQNYAPQLMLGTYKSVDRNTPVVP